MTRNRVSLLAQQEHSSSVANLVANVAAVVVSSAVRRRVWQRRRRRQRTNRGSVPGRLSFRKRTRRSVKDVFNKLGQLYFRRAYRMTFNTFKRLANILRPYIIAAAGKKGTTKFIPNGPISPDVRLACAIRWFAGGSLYDIMTTYGIGHTDTMNSCWYVVDAINKHPRFAIKYPDDHGVQRSIADGFHKVSGANFQCCVGAIDGILIWIHKPSDKDCGEAGCSPGKFNCA